MAYARITNTRNGTAAINYAYEEPSHKKGMDRVLSASGSNLDTDFAMMQMSDTWKSNGKDKGDYVQMYRVIQSFGDDELSVNNPDDIEMANQIGYEFAQEMYPDRQALIVTQADGDGGMLHNHVLVNSVSFVDGKSLRGKNTGFVAVAEGTNEAMRKHGFNPKPVPNGTKNKTTMAERKLSEKGEYVWKDDLKQRIEAGMNHEDVLSRDDFIQYMSDEQAVNVRFRGNAKDSDGNRIKGMSYDFEDENGSKRTARASRLGTSFQSDVLDDAIERNKEADKEMSAVSPIDDIDGFVENINMSVNQELESRREAPKKKNDRTDAKVDDKQDSDVAERIERERIEKERERERRRKERESFEQDDDMKEMMSELRNKMHGRLDAYSPNRQYERKSDEKADLFDRVDSKYYKTESEKPNKEKEEEKQRLAEIEAEKQRQLQIQKEKEASKQREYEDYIASKQRNIRNNPILVEVESEEPKEKEEPEPEEELEDDGPDL